MSIQTEWVPMTVADGTRMRAYVAHPAGPPRAGLLVFQEAFGVNVHIRSVTERFAREGYLSVAPELFHRTGDGIEIDYTDLARAMPILRQVTTEGLSADIRAAYDWLQKDSGGKIATAAVGYCMGGRTAFLAAQAVPVACAISYYGGGIAPSQFGPGLLDRVHDVQAPLLLFWGGLDTHIGPEQIQQVTGALKAAKKAYVNVEFSDADHGFSCDARASYNAQAAGEAWALTRAFLETHAGAKVRKSANC